MRLLKWIFTLTLVIGLALAGLIFFYNFRDQSLEPEVAEALAFEPALSDKQKSAYFYALGVHSDASGDFEKTGRALYAEFLKSPTPAKFWSEKVAPRNPWDDTFIGCVPEYKVCTSAFVKKYPEIKQELNHGSGTMDEYIELLSYRTIGDLFRGSRELPFTKIWLVDPRMHRKFLLQLAVWISEGKAAQATKALDDANAYMTSLFADPSLFELNVVAQILSDNADFAAEEKLKLAPIKIPADIFANTLRRELRILKNLVENFSSESDGPVLKPGWRQVLPMRFVLLPGETYNDFWKFNHGRPSESSILENPLGKEILKLTDVHLAQRKARIEALLQKIN